MTAAKDGCAKPPASNCYSVAFATANSEWLRDSQSLLCKVIAKGDIVVLRNRMFRIAPLQLYDS